MRKAIAVVAFTLCALIASAQSRDVKRIQERFMAPCCWAESVAVHRSEIATEMRAEIAHWVAQGKSEDEIVSIYVGRYGERILMEPRGRVHWWLVTIPIVVSIAALAWLTWYVRRRTRATPPAPVTGPLPDVPEFD